MAELEGISEFNEGVEILELDYVAEKPLWNPKGFFILTILFSYIPISIFFTLNFHRMKEIRERNIAILVTILATIYIAFIILFVEHESALRIAFAPVTFGLAYYFSKYQTKLFNKHIENGAKEASSVLPVVVSLIVAAGLIFVYIWSSSIEEQMEKQTYDRYNDYIIYWSDVSNEQVEGVADYFERFGLFLDDDVSIEVIFYENGGKYILAMSFIDEVLENPGLIEEVDAIRLEVAEQLVVDDNEMEFHLYDVDAELYHVVK